MKLLESRSGCHFSKVAISNTDRGDACYPAYVTDEGTWPVRVQRGNNQHKTHQLQVQVMGTTGVLILNHKDLYNPEFQNSLGITAKDIQPL